MADNNYFSIADNIAPITVGPEWRAPWRALDYDDVFKLSHAIDITIKNVTIPGGKEDAIDMNRDTAMVIVENVLIHPNGKYGFTIKGGTHAVLLENVVFKTHGKTYDIDLGNYSEESDKKTTGITLRNVTAADGKPVRVRVLHADKPRIEGGNVKLTVYPSWFVSIIRFFRGLF